MHLIDENINEDQREALIARRVRVRQIGFEVGDVGMGDDDIISLLHRLPRSTFFTRDRDFYEQRLCHRHYCLVDLAVGRNEVTEYVVRLLRHRDFSTLARRVGKVLRVSSVGIRYFVGGRQGEFVADWAE